MAESIATGARSVREESRAGSGAALVILAAAMQVPMGILSSTLVPAFVDRTTALFVYAGIWLTLTHVMMLAGVATLARTDAAGKGWLKRVAFTTALAGLGAMVLGESVLRINFDLGNAFFGIATPLAAVGFVLLGIAIIRARRWSGWHRYAALACGLYVPVVLIPAFIASKGPSFIALSGWAVCYLALGVAIRANQERA